MAEPLFRGYGGVISFCGLVSTVKVLEDNVLVREALRTGGLRGVLVVDGGKSVRCALVGDRLAELAYENGWTGVVVNGCIRDSTEIGDIPLG